jgi:hypothetical protein
LRGLQKPDFYAAPCTGIEPEVNRGRILKAVQSDLNHRLRRYLIEGGFPEALGADPRDRFALLRSYVDVVVLRDVIERHAVTNPLALRWMQRQLLANAGASFSIQKFYNALRSQGIAVGKDTLHTYLGHLEDTFLIRTIGLHTWIPGNTKGDILYSSCQAFF